MHGVLKARRFIITGRVQGVGYRYYVIRHARRLGLHGWVRNCPDSSVETLSQGQAGVLDQFESVLRSGPPGAFVQNVTTNNAEWVDGLDGFTVVY